jgi:hypothetical protein
MGELQIESLKRQETPDLHHKNRTDRAIEFNPSHSDQIFVRDIVFTIKHE